MKNYQNWTRKALIDKASETYGVYTLGTTQSAKAIHSAEHGYINYIVYLAPWTASGHNTCPGGKYCHASCLFGSGRAKISAWGDGNRINRARIARTKMFFRDRALFVELLKREIRATANFAKKNGMKFCVRLNGTSDLSPLAFVDARGVNILDAMPDIMFYDYTKVASRLDHEWPSNYDITFSHDGYNRSKCEEILKKGGRVAVVFDNSSFPKTLWGAPVVSGDAYDMRFLDPRGSVIGLKYKPTANDYKIVKGKRVYKGAPDTPFVVKTASL